MIRTFLNNMLARFHGNRIQIIQHDESTRFLPLVVAVVVFLITVALAATFSVNTTVSKWQTNLSGSMTVQVIPGAEQSAVELQQTTEDALEVILQYDGVKDARILDDEETIKLVEAWLGEGALPRSLPFPKVIDVSLKQGKYVDTDLLAAELGQISKNIVVDDHQVWLAKLISFVESFEVAAIVALILIVLAGMAVVILATKTTLAVHKQVIEILHLIGARDFFIGRQFAAKAFIASFLGGILGTIIAFIVLFIIGLSAAQLEGGLQPSFDLTILHYVILIALPLFVGLVAMGISLWTVMKRLGKMT